MRSGRRWPRDRADDRRARCLSLDVLFRSGEHDVLIEHLMPEIRDVAMRIRGLTPEQREDVIGETVVHLLGEWARGKTYGDVTIVAVARQRAKYVARDLFQEMKEPRRRGFRVVPLDYAFPTHDGDGEGPELEAPDPSRAPEDLLVDGDVASRVLAALPPRERDVFRMRCFEGLASYEVAERLECEPNAVDQAYHRAKRRLREDGLDL